MKRLLISASFLLVLAGSFSSCKKTIEGDYLNPELTTTGDLSKLLSGMYLNKRIHPSYWDYTTFLLPTLGAYSQLSVNAPATQEYVPSMTYNQNRWDDYYSGSVPSSGSSYDYNYNGPGIMSTYREMQTTYAALSATEQAKQYVYLACAQVVLADQTAQMVDLWGDIPFSQAGSLNTSSRSVSYAKFDDAAGLYDTLIANLKTLNTFFDTVSLSTEVSSNLQKQDILLGGSLTLWRRYVNSLRFRLLMRISYQNTSEAQTEVTAMLADPTTYPMITDNTMNVTLKESPTTLKSDLLSAFTANPYAPAYLLDTLMAANNDPRTAVLWDSVRGQAYHGFPTNGTVSDYDNGGWATFDSATFMYNYNVPGVLFTAAEVSFLTAEANERWGAGSTSAATAYANGINQSVAFYYGINQSKILSAGTWASLASPSQASIDAYIAGSNIAYSGTQAHKLALIGTQNWLNFFILQSGQAWAELRRTKYPALTFPTASYGDAPQPPTRLLYPTTESEYNASNYATVSSKDTRTTKIFWDVR
ncbi:SusD/RagB family nutrient-binding outer membrane lipoprotein [Dinghuibacter silviterrae]|uniref:SusD-like starch-binding protein associating with outer membrane n=1 Tax=Dinghuibacter silviterrae TaxID=1539049 RepID=A0A4R8DN55_9BACT|nr:SusD/RagB family nutrient-binding outer membrane lipoprotein [Dinghuibacter silviterrae]TDW99127.1 SusD-like starch-binding protein associating with outer membrane [Dinghuibacter silviterrae]